MFLALGNTQVIPASSYLDEADILVRATDAQISNKKDYMMNAKKKTAG